MTYELQPAPPVGSIVTDGEREWVRLDHHSSRAYFRDLNDPDTVPIPWILLLEQNGPLDLVPPRPVLEG